MTSNREAVAKALRDAVEALIVEYAYGRSRTVDEVAADILALLTAPAEPVAFWMVERDEPAPDGRPMSEPTNQEAANTRLIRKLQDGDGLNIGERYYLAGLVATPPVEPQEPACPVEIVPPHAFVRPTGDYCAVCGMDREAHEFGYDEPASPVEPQQSERDVCDCGFPPYPHYRPSDLAERLTQPTTPSPAEKWRQMFRAGEPRPGAHLRPDGWPCSYLHNGEHCNKCGFTTEPASAVDVEALAPHYSGEKSRRFWAEVNALPPGDTDTLYFAGVLLQNMEEDVLKALRSAALRTKEPTDG